MLLWGALSAPEGHQNLPWDPDPSRSTVTQFPRHVGFSPSPAASSREILPRHPVRNGERAARGRGGNGARKAGKSTKHAVGKIQDPFSPSGAPLCRSRHFPKPTAKNKRNAHCLFLGGKHSFCVFSSLSAQICCYSETTFPHHQRGALPPTPAPHTCPPMPTTPLGNFP